MAFNYELIPQFSPYVLLAWTIIMWIHLWVRERFWKAHPYVLGRLFIGFAWLMISFLIASKTLAIIGAALVGISLVQVKKWKQGEHAIDWDTMKPIDKVIWVSHIIAIFLFASALLVSVYLG